MNATNVIETQINSPELYLEKYIVFKHN